MSETYDGDKDNTKERTKDLEEGISSPEVEFRGFVSTADAKLPKVKLERLDISPYLKNNLLHKSMPIQRFFQSCTVSLARENLLELKRKFDSSEKALKCKICTKVYSSEKKLHKHLENKQIILKSKEQKRVSFSDNVIIHEVHEYHRCRKCPKIFETYNLLKQHSRKKHRKRKCYVCHYCTKKFVDRMIFKVHLKLHCDSCGKLFPNKSTYNDHRRLECRILKLHKCKTCKSAFYKFMDLRDHNYEHTDNCFICDVCKEKFTDKCLLGHHFTYLHFDKKPKKIFETCKLMTKKIYFCNFCTYSCGNKSLMQNHTDRLPDLTNIVKTSYGDYFFCDQCLSTFKSETEMLHHKWTHFLKTPKSILKRDTIKKTDNENQKENQNVSISFENIINCKIKAIYSTEDKSKQKTDSEMSEENSKDTNVKLVPLILSKTVFNIKQEMPTFLKPIKVVLEKIEIPDMYKKGINNDNNSNMQENKTSMPESNSNMLENNSDMPENNFYRTESNSEKHVNNSILTETNPNITEKNSEKVIITSILQEKFNIIPVVNHTNPGNTGMPVPVNNGILLDKNIIMPGNNSNNPQIINALPDINNVMPVNNKSPILSQILNNNQQKINVKTSDVIKKTKNAVINTTSRKTLLSEFKCEHCGKYFSTNYCLHRHMIQVHWDFEHLRCRMCEETFVWPSLLKSHKCIRLNLPEMPFDDARPEITLQNGHESQFMHCPNLTAEKYPPFRDPRADFYLQQYQNMAFGETNEGNSQENEGSDSEMVDFEIPPPEVELTECDTALLIDGEDNLSNSGYRVVVQEVPIEF